MHELYYSPAIVPNDFFTGGKMTHQSKRNTHFRSDQTTIFTLVL